MENHVQSDLAQEQAELEDLITVVGKSSRLGMLLEFLGRQYFAGDSDRLDEFTIATEVFGRSKLAFDASQDAIARVEMHRLRKRLKEFYESAGRDHAVQISIPHGSYAPSFTKRISVRQQVEAIGASIDEAWDPAPPAARESHTEVQREKQSTRWNYAMLALALAGGLLGASYLRSRMSPEANRSGAVTPAALEQSVPALTDGAPVRILCGYSGAPQTDSAGNVWGPDRFFSGGGFWRRPETPVARTSDPFLYDYWRRGDSEYDIPLKPGTYELHLYFVESGPPIGGIDSFDVKINGNVALSGFDVAGDALGANIADERVFRDVSPAADGKLHIAFGDEMGSPEINAIEVLPGITHRTLPIRLVTQPSSYTDRQGHVWHSDDYFIGGHLSEHPVQIEGSPDPDLFSFERYGHFTYAIPVDTRDRYTLVLHFVEFYFGPHTAGGGGTGSRLFKVMCNGNTLLDNFDIYKEAGSLHLLTKSFPHLKPSAQGKLNITFEPIVNNATVSGIEVLDESR